jgi:hypothetical protein
VTVVRDECAGPGVAAPRIFKVAPRSERNLERAAIRRSTSKWDGQSWTESGVNVVACEICVTWILSEST